MSTLMTLRLAVIAAALAISVVRAERTTIRTQTGVLAEAIAEGLLRSVEPYPLRQVIAPGDIVGYLYTPFVRIARFVREKSAQGEAVDPGVIPADVSAPVLIVVMSPPIARPDGTSELKIARVLRPRAATPAGLSYYFVPNTRRLEQPLRVIDAETAGAIVGSLPAMNVGGVAAFPVSSIKSQRLEFCAYYVSVDAAGEPVYDVVAGFADGPFR